jgi:hypothetical protein
VVRHIKEHRPRYAPKEIRNRSNAHPALPSGNIETMRCRIAPHLGRA